MQAASIENGHKVTQMENAGMEIAVRGTTL